MYGAQSNQRPPYAPFRPPVATGGVYGMQSAQPWPMPARLPPNKRRLGEPTWARPPQMTTVLPENNKTLVGPYRLPFDKGQLEAMDKMQILEAASVLRAKHTECTREIDAYQHRARAQALQSGLGRGLTNDIKQLFQLLRAIEQAYEQLSEAHNAKKTIQLSPPRPPAVQSQQEQWLLTQQQPQSQVESVTVQNQRETMEEVVVQQPERPASQPTADTEPPPVEEEAVIALVTKEKLHSLSAQIDPNAVLSNEVVELFSFIAEEYLDDLVKSSCGMARHRKATCVSTQDIVLHLDVNWHTQVAGYGPDPGRPRPNSTQGHRNRLATIQKAASNTGRR